MTTVRLQSTILFAAWFIVIRIASAEAQTVVVGSTTIALPSSDGFFRYDGKNTKVDSLEQQLVPKSNRLLRSFWFRGNVGGGARRSFSGKRASVQRRVVARHRIHRHEA